MKSFPSRYNSAILTKLVVFLKSIQLFCLNLACSKEEEILCCVGSFTKAAWVEAVAFRKRAVGFGKRAVAIARSEPLSSMQRSLPSASGCTTRLLGEG